MGGGGEGEKEIKRRMGDLEKMSPFRRKGGGGGGGGQIDPEASSSPRLVSPFLPLVFVFSFSPFFFSLRKGVFFLPCLLVFVSFRFLNCFLLALVSILFCRVLIGRYLLLLKS